MQKGFHWNLDQAAKVIEYLPSAEALLEENKNWSLKESEEKRCKLFDAVTEWEVCHEIGKKAEAKIMEIISLRCKVPMLKEKKWEAIGEQGERVSQQRDVLHLVEQELDLTLLQTKIVTVITKEWLKQKMRSCVVQNLGDYLQAQRLRKKLFFLHKVHYKAFTILSTKRAYMSDEDQMAIYKKKVTYKIVANDLVMDLTIKPSPTRPWSFPTDVVVEWNYNDIPYRKVVVECEEGSIGAIRFDNATANHAPFFEPKGCKYSIFTVPRKHFFHMYGANLSLRTPPVTCKTQVPEDMRTSYLPLLNCPSESASKSAKERAEMKDKIKDNKPTNDVKKDDVKKDTEPTKVWNKPKPPHPMRLS